MGGDTITSPSSISGKHSIFLCVCVSKCLKIRSHFYCCFSSFFFPHRIFQRTKRGFCVFFFCKTQYWGTVNSVTYKTHFFIYAEEDSPSLEQELSNSASQAPTFFRYGIRIILDSLCLLILESCMLYVILVYRETEKFKLDHMTLMVSLGSIWKESNI